MRLWVAALALLFIVGLLFLLYLGRAPSSPPLTGADTNSLEGPGQLAHVARQTGGLAAAATTSPAGDLPVISPVLNKAPTSSPAQVEVPPTPESASLPPQTILENMRRSVRQYESAFGGNPVGTNPEITKALQGDNPKQINFLKTDDGNRVNSNGELVDAWGTPYFFHQLSATDMEIRSAGPDRRMWTDDDLVTR